MLCLQLCNMLFNLSIVQARYLSTFGSGTLTDTVCGMMKAILNNSLALQFNWIGNRQKNSFADLHLSQVICGK